MVNLRFICALLAGLIAAPALAQQFPLTMPPNSVYGRLSNATGPGQAIPFATLSARLATIAPAGTLTGATLAPNVLNSSLTSVGTLTSLTARAITLLGTSAATSLVINPNGSKTAAVNWATNTANWSAGVDYANAGGTDFFITDNVGGNRRLAISSTGLVSLIGSAAVVEGSIPNPTSLLVVAGSAGAPVTTDIGTLTVSRHEAINVATTYASAGYFHSTNTGSGQPIGIYGSARNTGSGDAVGVFGLASASGSAVKAAFGLYADARADSATTAAIAIETSTSNNSGTDHPYSANPAGGNKSIGLDLVYGGSPAKLGSAAVQIRSGGGQWDVGIGFMQCACIKTASIQDDSDSVTLFLAASGSHTNGIDLSAATFSGSPFKSAGFSVGNAGAATALSASLTNTAGGTLKVNTSNNTFIGEIAGNASTDGLRISNGGNGTDLRVDSTRASSRNYGWRINAVALGDFALYQSGSAGADPYVGNPILYVNLSGGVSVGSGADPGIGRINANVGFNAAGTAGLSTTKTVRASGGAADCTLIYIGGILTGGTC